MKVLYCPNCGSQTFEKQGSNYICRHCGGLFTDDYVQTEKERIKSLFSEALAGQKEEQIANLRKNLWNAAREENISSTKVLQYAREIKKLLPEDFMANFYEVACGENVKALNKFLNNVNDKLGGIYAADIAQFLVRGMEYSTVLPLKNLISRHLKDGEYKKYMTAVEDEAQKIKNGVYSPQVPRDVFLAYSSKDYEAVNEIVEFLEENGISCFVALRNLRHGKGSVENYGNELKTAMHNCKCVVFLSSNNSRSLECDALKIELPYIRDNEPKMGRIEYLLEEYTNTNFAARAICEEFFKDLEYCRDKEDLIRRILGYITGFKEEKPLSKFKYCMACGAENPQKTNFCMECGSREFVATHEEYALKKQQQEQAELRQKLEAEYAQKLKKQQQEYEQKLKTQQELRLKAEKEAAAQKQARAAAQKQVKTAQPAPKTQVQPPKTQDVIAKTPNTPPVEDGIIHEGANYPVITLGRWPQSKLKEGVSIQLPDTREHYFKGSDGCVYFKTGRGYFKEEPIKWRILCRTGNRALVLCEDLIITNVLCPGAVPNYAKSALRGWLNKEFFTSAFSEEEQAVIKNTLVENGIKSTGEPKNPNICEDTEDRVFLPSCEEVFTKYGLTAKDRQKVFSDYSFEYGADARNIDGKMYGDWYTRSPATQEGMVIAVHNDGSKVYCRSSMGRVGIAPAMWIELGKDGLTVDEAGGVKTALFGMWPKSRKPDGVILGKADARGNATGSDGYKYALKDGVWYKVEPIKWRLYGSGDRVVALCEDVIDGIRFDGSVNNYAQSEIKSWLNGNFFAAAFTPAEQARICSVVLDNGAGGDLPYAPQKTENRVFLPSLKEAQVTFGLTGTAVQKKEFTEYAKHAVGFISPAYDMLWWWLRSPYRPNGVGRADYATVLQNNYASGIFVGRKCGVVPAILIDLKGGEDPAQTVPEKEHKGRFIQLGKWPRSKKAQNVSLEGKTFGLYGGMYFPGSDGEEYEQADFTKVSAPGYDGEEDVLYFKREPLTWRVLKEDKESGEALVMCEEVIYGDTIPDPVKLRGWLNGKFLKEAFTAAERGFIAKTGVDGLHDKIFLLSREEAFAEGLTDSDRQLRVTDYAGLYGGVVCGGDTKYAPWWLRTPSDVQEGSLCYVGADGSCQKTWDVPCDSGFCGIVPAMRINLKELELAANPQSAHFNMLPVGTESGYPNANQPDKSKFTLRVGVNSKYGAELFLDKYTGKDIEVKIPRGVSWISSEAFPHKDKLVSVTIPEGVRVIDAKAFEGCYNLKVVNLPQTLEEIGQNAFASCWELTLPKLPNGIQKIGEGAFYGCNKLSQSLFLPLGLTQIGKAAFGMCVSIKEVFLPYGIEEIGGPPFAGSYNLEKIEVSKGGRYYSAGNCIIDGSTHKLVCGCSKSAIPQDGSVKKIGDYAFSGCKLRYITIPDGVEEIGRGAFSGCWYDYEAYKITIPQSVKIIGDAAFYFVRISSVTIPQSVETMGADIFYSGEKVARVDAVYCAAKKRPEGWSKDWNVYAKGELWPKRIKIAWGRTDQR